RGLVLLGTGRLAEELLLQLMRQALVRILRVGKLDQKLPDRRIARRARRFSVKPRRLVFHVFRIFPHLVEAERPHEPKWLVLHEPLHVLAADERQVFAEFRAIEVVAAGAVMHLLFRHLVEHLGRRWILLAQPFGEATVDAAVLFLVGDREGEDLLLGKIGKALQIRPHRKRQQWHTGLREFYIRAVLKRQTNPENSAMRFQATRHGLETVLQKLLHAYWRFARPMTVGVRALVIDGSGCILLVKHSYVSGWHLPGGGVEPGETLG